MELLDATIGSEPTTVLPNESNLTATPPPNHVLVSNKANPPKKESTSHLPLEFNSFDNRSLTALLPKLPLHDAQSHPHVYSVLNIDFVGLWQIRVSIAQMRS
ncbi:hypothetical protein PM082_007149 [Marasmius tenuissimus]|nr:hypothetical protein PM082_007149 [Marasmius tenuissimus]